MPLSGGVSRPSMKQWTKTFSTLFSRAMRSSANRCSHVRMHAAVADQADQVQLASAAALHGFEKQRLAEKFAAGDELIDARDVHLHDAARADIQVAHFAIAHLSFGQSDEGTGGMDQRVGKFLEQAVVVGLAREGDGVALGFGAVAPAVEDGEHDGSRSLGHSTRKGLTKPNSVTREFSRLETIVRLCFRGFLAILILIFLD